MLTSRSSDRFGGKLPVTACSLQRPDFVGCCHSGACPRTTQISLKQPASPHPALNRVVMSPDTLSCATSPDKVLIRRRIPCSEDAGPGAQVASENANASHIHQGWRRRVDQDARPEIRRHHFDLVSRNAVAVPERGKWRLRGLTVATSTGHARIVQFCR